MDDNFDFSKAIEEVGQINDWFQQEDIDLNHALEKYKRGLELIGKCKTQLTDFENKVREIKGEFDENLPSVIDQSQVTDDIKFDDSIQA